MAQTTIIIGNSSDETLKLIRKGAQPKGDTPLRNLQPKVAHRRIELQAREALEQKYMESGSVESWDAFGVQLIDSVGDIVNQLAFDKGALSAVDPQDKTRSWIDTGSSLSSTPGEIVLAAGLQVGLTKGELVLPDLVHGAYAVHSAHGPDRRFSDVQVRRRIGGNLRTLARVEHKHMGLRPDRHGRLQGVISEARIELDADALLHERPEHALERRMNNPESLQRFFAALVTTKAERSAFASLPELRFRLTTERQLIHTRLHPEGASAGRSVDLRADTFPVNYQPGTRGLGQVFHKSFSYTEALREILSAVRHA